MSVAILREEVIAVVHREDVKAALRKRYGTIEKAQEALGLKGQQLRDYFAGKSASAHAAIAKELNYEPEHLKVVSGIIPKCGDKFPNVSAGSV